MYATLIFTLAAALAGAVRASPVPESAHYPSDYTLPSTQPSPRARPQY
jgi:hypothetical protein